MNVTPIRQNTGYLHSRSMHKTGSSARECAKERHNSNIINNDKINTTIRSNSDGRVSFKGGGIHFIHHAANFTSNNPLVAEALFAIVVTCGLRPLTIMAGAKNDEDKSKCSYQAAKSISSGLVGLGTTALVGTPIAAATKKAKEAGAFKMPQSVKEESLGIVKKGVDILKEKAAELPEIAGISLSELTEGGKINLSVFKKAGKDAEKLFTKGVSEKLPDSAESIINAVKEQHTLDNYSNAAKNVADKMFQPVFMPIRATITIALVPIILGALGLKKSSGKQKEQEQAQNPFQNLNLSVIKDEKDVFGTFTGGVTK